FADEQGAYGNLVVVNHARGLQTRYAHLAKIRVRVGQRINAGETLGVVGTTGSPSSKESHLHFEIRQASKLGWVAENPTPYLQRINVKSLP
ncbi:MAG: M23 family metallopeptidase, partial [Leptolyngbyaceae bacterium]|nr:M23 family metallopeptidase [Leptolyngbyaceae bacterium]